jgi:hypothetical protein
MERPEPENNGEKPRKRQKRRQPLRSLGIELPEWLDDSLAPPVEEDRIGAMLEGQIDREERRRLAWLIFRFRSWAAAYCRLGLERNRRPPAPGT